MATSAGESERYVPGSRGDVWLGDVLRCFAALGAGADGERALIAELLGFQFAATPVSRPAPPSAQGRSRPPAEPRPESSSSVIAHHAPATTARPVALGVVRSREGEANAERTWQRERVTLEPERREHVAFQPAYEPLFEAGWTRAIVGSLCAVVTPDGGVDVDALVEQLARGRALTGLPVKRRRTLRRGAELLVDDGESMMPFARDVDELVARVAQVVGRDRTTVRRFAGHPWRSDEPAPAEEQVFASRYRPPPAGTPVVLISDLGLSRGARLRDGAPLAQWLAFARRLRDAECPLLAVVPLPPARWPKPLLRALRILSWDRRTLVAEARRAAGRESAR